MLFVLTLALASAQQPTPGDIEIVVYDDAFARWDDTRWLVETELMTPLGTWLAVDTNHGVTSYAVQVRSVLHCTKDTPLGKYRYQVECEIEDFAIQASTLRHRATPGDRAVAQQVLDAVDATLTGATVQLQVKSDGGVPNLDIEGLENATRREREAQEGLRQIMLRVMSGYHLRVPDAAQRPGQTIERNPTLLEVPSLTGVQGSSFWVHTASAYGSQNLVQSMGEGLVQAQVPAPADFSGEKPVTQAKQATSGMSRTADEPKGDAANKVETDPSAVGLQRESPYDQAMASKKGMESWFGVSGWHDPAESHDFTRAKGANGNGAVVEGVDLTYRVAASGLALFDRLSGVLTERIWTVQGHSTAGSLGGSVASPPFKNLGRLQILGPDDHPDLGESRQVGWPGARDPDGDAAHGLDPWVPLEVTADSQPRRTVAARTRAPRLLP